MKPRYSVMRIEKAKQQLLTGKSWSRPEIRSHQENDWSAEDETKLKALFRDILAKHPQPTHKQLNDAIDYQTCFSSGIHAVNARIKDMITIEQDDGTVIYKNFTQQWGFPG